MMRYEWRDNTLAKAIRLCPIEGDHMHFSSDPLLAPNGHEHAAAVALVANGVTEVPLYRWLLGSEDDDRPAHWWAELLLAAHGDQGARGSRDQGGRLCGVALWAPPGRTRPDYAATLVERTRQMVTGVPGFVQRYREMWAAEEGYRPGSASVDIVFATVDVSLRRSGVLAELIDPLIDSADKAGIAVVTRASDPALAAVYERRWGTTPRAEYRVPGGPTVWILQRDPGD